MWVVFGNWACPFSVYWLSAVIRVTPHSAREHTHTLAKKQHIKPSNLFWKHTPQPPSRVFALSGTRAMLLTFHSIPGPRVGTDTDLPPHLLPTPHCFKNNTHKTYCGTSQNPHKIIHIFDPCHFFFHAAFPPCAPGDAPVQWCHQQVISWWETSVLLRDENSIRSPTTLFILINKEFLIWLSTSDVGVWSVSQYRVSKMAVWE